MIGALRVLAVVPARSGSKGIPGKNMRRLAGVSLIGWAGRTLGEALFVDRRVISTDSEEYAAEGKRFGLEAPFLRPAALSTDEAGAVETLQHAVATTEGVDGCRYDIVLIVEPTSPLRRAADLERCASRLVSESADAVITVSVLDSKAHPRKLLSLRDGQLGFLAADGPGVSRRQELEPLYWRNGVCYALRRGLLMGRGLILGGLMLGELIERPIVNIDGPLDLAWAEFLLARGEG